MDRGSDYWQKFWQRRTNRRRLIRGIGIGSMGLGAAALIGCSGGCKGAKTTGQAPGAAQEPRSGDELNFAVADAPPSFDGHRETTFAMIHPVRPITARSSASTRTISPRSSVMLPRAGARPTVRP